VEKEAIIDMRKPIKGLTDAVRQVLGEHNSALWWKDICCEIKDRGLVHVAPEQEEITYGQPNFYHSVRRILTELVKRGEAIRVERAMYKKA
jgi:hypothetical protein